MASIVEHNSRKSLDENFEKKQNLVMDPLQRCVVIVNCKKKTLRDSTPRLGLGTWLAVAVSVVQR
jgi:hypothetical protein